MPKFPDRWFDYTNTGNIIQGTRLITFKVPLKESFFANNKKISENSRFTPTTLIESIRGQGRNLGLVVDLTYTTRYYDPEEFTRNGVQYEKIFVEGHEIPKMEVIEKFYDVLDNFFQNSEEDSLVGVHCTHGVNRTGYVVCRYMVEHLGMKATEALEAYRIARGYPVERMNYINDLKRRAGEHVDKKDEDEEKKQQKDRHRSHHRREKRGGNSYHHHGRGNTAHRNDGRGHYQNGGGKDKSGHQHFDHNVEQWEDQNGQYKDQGAYGYTWQQEYWNGQYNDQGAYGYTEQQENWNGQYNDQGAYGYTEQQENWNGQYNDQGAYGYTEQQENWNGQYNDQGAYGYTEQQENWNGQYNEQGAYGYTEQQENWNGQYNDQGADPREYLEYVSYDCNNRGNWSRWQQSYQGNSWGRQQSYQGNRGDRQQSYQGNRGDRQQSYQGNRGDRQHNNHFENNPRANGYNPHHCGSRSQGFHSYNSGSDSRPTRGAARGRRSH